MDNRDLIYDDKLILSGIIGICNTYDYMKQAVGIKDIDNDVVFKGKVFTAKGTEFVFTKGMKELLGCTDYYIEMKTAFNDNPVTLDDIKKASVFKGDAKPTYQIYHSSYIGYYGAEQQFKVGRQSILQLLEQNLNRYAYIQMDIYRKIRR